MKREKKKGEKMKKKLKVMLLSALSLIVLTGCAEGSSSGSGNEFNEDKDIAVISREDGSGTRGAFIELFGIEEKKDDGTKKDLTTKEAVIAKQTDVMISNVTGDDYAIGYISLGSMNDSVKALEIGGVIPSIENVKNGSYEISRPFNIATKGEQTGLAKDFIDFIMSAEGQAVVGKSYIPVEDNAVAYSGNKPSGKIVVAGSSSVTPIMEKLKEAYLEINANAEIEIQQSDSSAGITGVIEGTCDIGMASRDLKEEEAKELTSLQIALDGIAVIVNNSNPKTNLSKESVKEIFTGEVITWSEVTE